MNESTPPYAGYPDLPHKINEWISKSESAGSAFNEFFRDKGRIVERPKIGLPYYESEPIPAIFVDEKSWPPMLAVGALEYPQWHAFGVLAHEIGHHRFNAITVPFTGNTPQQYVQYRSELEGQAIFGAFRIFRELEAVPPFDKRLPYDSIGYLHGIELAQFYKDWKDGRLDDAQAVAAIADKVADTPFRRSDPAPGKDGALADQDGDGRLTHRDLYLRDFQRIPRFHPQPDAPAVEPSAAVQPAAIPLLDNPAHPGHTLYAQALQGMQANPRFPAEQQHQQLAANLVAAIATLPEDRVKDGLLQERLSRIDTVTLSSDGTALMAIDGKPDANLRLRYGMPLAQALTVA